MSKYREIPINCSICNHEFPFTLWETINVTLDPSLRQKTLNGEIFIIECPHCKEKHHVHFNTLYHDMDNKFMIKYDPYQREYDDCEEIYMHNMLKLCDGYIFRYVYGLNNFKEKILILENGLNDIVIERIKHFVINHNSLPQNNIQLRFIGRNKKYVENKKIETIDFVFIKEIDNSQYKESLIELPIEEYYNQQLAVELDPRMKVCDWACVDNNWIANQLKLI